MRLGIFGGTFDPVHLGHLAAAEEAAQRFALAQALFVPAQRQPLKDAAPRASNADRLAMLQRAIAGNPRFAVSALELERPAPSYTVDTLRALHVNYGPGCELYFLIGIDAANVFDRWREPAAVLRLARLIVMSRSEEREPDWPMLRAIAPDAADRIDLLAVPDVDVSSRDLRRRVAAGEPIRYQVPESVREYIESHGLYRSEMHGVGVRTQALAVEPLVPGDREWVRRFVRERWGAETVAGHGAIYYPNELPGFVATQDGERVGLLTYQIAGRACEVVTIDSLRPATGIGTALIDAATAAARAAGCRRVWLITTNDNLNALRFYQKRGFVIAALRPNAIAAARTLKPEIPLLGHDAIPLRDEIELELALDDAR